MRTKAPDPSTVRSTVIRLWVTEAEVELFKRKAREAGCKSVSEYIRLRCIDGIGTMLDYSVLRKASIRNKESGNPHQGKHQSETRKASIRARTALANEIKSCS